MRYFILLLLAGLLRGQVPLSSLLPSGTPGQAIVYSTQWNPGVGGISCTLTAVTSITCTHNLNNASVRVWIWTSGGDLVRSALVDRVSANAVTLTFSVSFTGVAVIK